MPRGASAAREAAGRLGMAAAKALVILTVLAAPLAASVQDGANSTCPVLIDEPIDLTTFTDYQGWRVYFCCSKCLRKFEAAPGDYVANLPPAAAVPVDPTRSSGAAQDAKSTHGGAVAPRDGEPPGHSHGVSQGGLTEGGDSGETSPAPSRGHVHHEGGEQRSGLAHLVEWTGKFHPMVIHFPIALAIAAAFAELLFLVGRSPWDDSTARFCTMFGALSAVVAAGLGWARASGGDFSSSVADTVELHRWLGTGTAAWLTAAAVTSDLAHRRNAPRWLGRYRFLLFSGIVLIGVTGHLGAMVTHGPDYFAW